MFQVVLPESVPSTPPAIERRIEIRPDGTRPGSPSPDLDGFTQQLVVQPVLAQYGNGLDNGPVSVHRLRHSAKPLLTWK
jgi:hypothetical protein